MEHAIALSVPLEVTLKSGRNWYEVETMARGDVRTCIAVAAVLALTLPVVTVHAPRADLTLEVARTEAQRETGLMNRTALPPHTGMIFVFERDSRSRSG